LNKSLPFPVVTTSHQFIADFNDVELVVLPRTSPYTFCADAKLNTDKFINPNMDNNDANKIFLIVFMRLE
jgi:hypothetical protein